MKIPRSLIGKEIRVRWRDPGGAKLRSRTRDASDLPGGWQALATWTMQGRIQELKEGVITLVQSVGEDAPHEQQDPVTDFEVQFIPESLVEQIVELIEGQKLTDPT